MGLGILDNGAGVPTRREQRLGVDQRGAAGVDAPDATGDALDGDANAAGVVEPAAIRPGAILAIVGIGGERRPERFGRGMRLHRAGEESLDLHAVGAPFDHLPFQFRGGRDERPVDGFHVGAELVGEVLGRLGREAGGFLPRCAQVEVHEGRGHPGAGQEDGPDDEDLEPVGQAAAGEAGDPADHGGLFW